MNRMGSDEHAAREPTPRGARAWDAASMAARDAWRFAWTAPALEDLDRLVAWAGTAEDPVTEYQRDTLTLPALDALAASMCREIRTGSGVALLSGLPAELPDLAHRMAFLAVGLRTGASLDNYGRLYDVLDRGEDYRARAVPISMTRDETSFHTDSSARSVEPDHVGLLCLRAARVGGESLLTSAVRVHDELRGWCPDALALLYRDYMRDVVTPGMERNEATVRANAFPVFRESADRDVPVFRYMRYWIERAQDFVGGTLTLDEVHAFDRLDALLAEPQLVLRFRLGRGDMVWIDNKTVAHNRSAYDDEPGARRHLVRMWTGEP